MRLCQLDALFEPLRQTQLSSCVVQFGLVFRPSAVGAWRLGHRHLVSQVPSSSNVLEPGRPTEGSVARVVHTLPPIATHRRTLRRGTPSRPLVGGRAAVDVGTCMVFAARSRQAGAWGDLPHGRLGAPPSRTAARLSRVIRRPGHRSCSFHAPLVRTVTRAGRASRSRSTPRWLPQCRWGHPWRRRTTTPIGEDCSPVNWWRHFGKVHVPAAPDTPRQSEAATPKEFGNPRLPAECVPLFQSVTQRGVGPYGQCLRDAYEVIVRTCAPALWSWRHASLASARLLKRRTTT